MIGAIPNPKKTVSVEFPINVIKEAVLNVREVDIQYKLTSSNELMNLYTYQASEFLSLGVYVDINLSKISESKTDINIEVRRKIGSFDKSYEVTQANQHIEKLLSLITKAIQLTEEQKLQILEKYKVKEAALNGFSGHKFKCGFCKNKFYADSNLNVTVICPHCKKTVNLPVKLTKDAQGENLGKIILIVIVIAIVIAIFSIR